MPSETQAPQKTTFTDPEALHNAIDDWQLRDWNFEAYVLVVPAAKSPYVVAGTNPLSCQMLADDAVRACCNASQRFNAVWGHPKHTWIGTACDMSAVRGETHQRNSVAEAVITCLVVGHGVPGYGGKLFGTIGFHRPGDLPEAIEQKQAVRLLRAAAAA